MNGVKIIKENDTYFMEKYLIREEVIIGRPAQNLHNIRKIPFYKS